jgi:hypothetical protein
MNPGIINKPNNIQIKHIHNKNNHANRIENLSLIANPNGFVQGMFLLAIGLLFQISTTSHP